MFQSSTGSVAGCNRGRCCTRSSACTCFNPQPALWPDATWAGLHRPVATPSFNPQPALWPDATSSCSIHDHRAFPGSFNPQPALWPDATSRSTAGPPPQSCFNRQPALWPDATRHNRPSAGCPKFQSSTGSVAGCNRSLPSGIGWCNMRVSILNRLCGRMQPDAADVNLRNPQVSILNRLCGRMQLRDGNFDKVPALVFQSSTGSVAGCNQTPVTAWAWQQRWQPVSILNRLCGRMQPPTNSCTASSCGVSILNRLCGRMQRARTAVGHLVMSFNPQPALWPDATPVPGFPIGSSRTSSTMPSDDHFRHELSKSFTRATIRTRTSNVRGRQQRVRVTPPAGR